MPSNECCWFFFFFRLHIYLHILGKMRFVFVGWWGAFGVLMKLIENFSKLRMKKKLNELFLFIIFLMIVFFSFTNKRNIKRTQFAHENAMYVLLCGMRRAINQIHPKWKLFNPSWLAVCLISDPHDILDILKINTHLHTHMIAVFAS